MSKKKPPGGGKKKAAPSVSASKKASKARAEGKPKSPGLGFDPTLLGVWILLMATPLIFQPGLTDNFRPPKLFASELFGLLSLTLLSTRLWRSPPPAGRKIFALPVVWVALLLPTVAIIAGLLSTHSAHVNRSLPSFLIGLSCWFGWSLALTAEERWRLLRATVIPATLLSILAILQFHGLFDPFTFERRLTQRLALTSMAGGAFDLAGYLLLPLLILQAWWRSASGRTRILLGFAMAVCTYGLLLTQTLTVVAAVMTAVCVYWAPQIPRRRLAVGAIALVVAGALLVFASPLRPRLVSKLSSLQKGEMNRLLTGRLDGWRAATHMIAKHPITGVGPGAFRAEFGIARLELREAGVGFFRGQHHVFFVNAHNDWLEAAAEWGVPGGAILLGSFWLLWTRRRTRKPGEGHVDEARSIELAACAGIVVLASTNFPFHLALIAYPWLLFFSGIPATRIDPEDEGHPSPARSSRGSGKLLAVLSVSFFLGWIFVRFYEARDLLGADRLLVMVEGRSLALLAAGNKVPAQAMQQHISMMKRAEQLDPASVSIPLTLGGQYMLMKRYPAAIRSLERAIKLEPRAEPYANLARCYLALDETEKALAAIDKAVKLDHNQQKVFRSILKRERRHRQWQEQQKDEAS